MDYFLEMEKDMLLEETLLLSEVQVRSVKDDNKNHMEKLKIKLAKLKSKLKPTQKLATSVGNLNREQKEHLKKLTKRYSGVNKCKMMAGYLLFCTKESNQGYTMVYAILLDETKPNKIKLKLVQSSLLKF